MNDSLHPEPRIYTLSAPSIPEKLDPVITEILTHHHGVLGIPIPGADKSTGKLFDLVAAAQSSEQLMIIDVKDGVTFVDEFTRQDKHPVDLSLVERLARKAALAPLPHRPNTPDTSERK